MSTHRNNGIAYRCIITAYLRLLSVTRSSVRSRLIKGAASAEETISDKRANRTVTRLRKMRCEHDASKRSPELFTFMSQPGFSVAMLAKAWCPKIVRPPHCPPLGRLQCWATAHSGAGGLPGQYWDFLKIQSWASASVSKSPM